MKKKEKLKPVLAYVPVSLPDVHKLVAGTGIKAALVMVFFHILYMFRLLNTANKRVTKTDRYHGGFVMVNSKVFRKLLTSRYKRVIQLLESQNLLIVRRTNTGSVSYIRNSASAQYKIPGHLLKGEGIKHYRKEKITDQAVLRAIYNTKDYFYHRSFVSRHLPLNTTHQAMSRILDAVRFKLVPAEKFLTDVLNGKILVPPTDSGILRDYPSMYLIMVAVNDGFQFHKCVDGFGGRFHTIFTSLWKLLRPFIYFTDEPDEPIVNIDICNSQPYFSSVCVGTELVKTLLPEFVPVVENVGKYTVDESFSKYSALCARGQIYDYWASIRGIARDDAKKEILYVMFSPNRRSRREKFMKEPKRAFAKEFPAVYACFQAIKSLTEKELPQVKEVLLNEHGLLKGNPYHKFLSAMMQRAESRIMIERIAPKLIATNIKFITVHDSFIVKEKDAVTVKGIMENEFKALGIQPPRIKVEKLNTTNSNPLKHE